MAASSSRAAHQQQTWSGTTPRPSTARRAPQSPAANAATLQRPARAPPLGLEAPAGLRPTHHNAPPQTQHPQPLLLAELEEVEHMVQQVQRMREGQVGFCWMERGGSACTGCICMRHARAHTPSPQDVVHGSAAILRSAAAVRATSQLFVAISAQYLRTWSTDVPTTHACTRRWPRTLRRWEAAVTAPQLQLQHCSQHQQQLRAPPRLMCSRSSAGAGPPKQLQQQ